MTPAAIFSLACLTLAAVVWLGLGLVVPGAVLTVVSGWWMAAFLESEE